LAGLSGSDPRAAHSRQRSQSIGGRPSGRGPGDPIIRVALFARRRQHSSEPGCGRAEHRANPSRAGRRATCRDLGSRPRTSLRPSRRSPRRQYLVREVRVGRSPRRAPDALSAHRGTPEV